MNELSITTKDLAKKSGVKEDTINSYLKKGGSLPNVVTATSIAKALGTTVEFLVSGFENKGSDDTEYEIRKYRKYSKFIDLLEKMTPKKIQSVEVMLKDFCSEYDSDEDEQEMNLDSVKNIESDEIQQETVDSESAQK